MFKEETLILIASLLSIAISTLLKPRRGTFTEDLRRNTLTGNPARTICTYLALSLWTLELRLSRITNTPIALRLGLTMMMGWADTESSPVKQMAYSPKLKIFRRVFFLGCTLPLYVKLVLSNAHHRWIQLFAATCLLDCAVMEMLHVIFASPPPLGRIYVCQGWPRQFLFGPDTGIFEVDTSQQDMKMLLQEKSDHARFKDLGSRDLCERISNVSNLLSATPSTTHKRKILFLIGIYRAVGGWECGHWRCIIHTILYQIGRLILGLQSLIASLFTTWLMYLVTRGKLSQLSHLILSNNLLHSGIQFLYNFTMRWILSLAFWFLCLKLPFSALQRLFPVVRRAVNALPVGLKRVVSFIVWAPCILVFCFFLSFPSKVTEWGLSVFLQVVVCAVWFIQRGLMPFAAELNNLQEDEEEEISKSSDDVQPDELGGKASDNIV